MPRDQVSEQEIEVLRAADGPSGGLVPAHNRMGDEVLNNLVTARELLADVRRWHKGAYCNDANDRFCAFGAVFVAAGFDARQAFSRIIDIPAVKERRALVKALPSAWTSKRVGEFNDHHTTTHADVLALFDRAISARRAELEV